MRIVLLEQEFHTHVVRTQHADIAVKRRLVLYLEQIQFPAIGKRKLVQPYLVIPVVQVKSLFDRHFGIVVPLPRNQHAVDRAVIRNHVIDTALLEAREQLAGDIIASEEHVFRRHQHIPIRILRFQHLRNGLVHIIALDMEADIQERKLVEDIDGRHHERIAPEHARHEQRDYGGKLYGRNREQALVRYVPLLQEGIDDQADIRRKEPHDHHVEHIVPGTVGGNVVPYPVDLYKFNRLVINIAEAHSRRQRKYDIDEKSENGVAPEREPHLANGKARIECQKRHEYRTNIVQLVRKDGLVEIRGKRQEEVPDTGNKDCKED